VKLVFLGTRGEIEARTPRHNMHTSLLVEYRGGRVMVDAGLDWRQELWKLRPRPHAIVVTHAHPDHAWGLQDGSPAPVYATDDAWHQMANYPIKARDRHRVEARTPFRVRDITFEAFPVEHSITRPGRRLPHHRGTGHRVLRPRPGLHKRPRRRPARL
jgi:phosphoribosyl 1,2-cyclic phosphodiesterase